MNHEEQTIGLATVYVAQGMLRAMVVRGALESAGISVLLSYESATPNLGIGVDGGGQVRVMVPIEWTEEAEQLLKSDPRAGEIFSVPPDVRKEDA